MEYLLSGLPRIVHSGATVTLTTATATVEFQTAEVAKVYLATDANGHLTVLRPSTYARPTALWCPIPLPRWHTSTSRQRMSMRLILHAPTIITHT
jgi:hypothetical protein